MPAAANDTRSAYVPGHHGSAWERVKPIAAGFDPGKLEAAVALAVARESCWPRTFYYPDGRYVGIVEWNEVSKTATCGTPVPRSSRAA